MQNNNPLVSIIIPTHNRATLLPKAINSALAQTYKPIEIIIINDGSQDNTDEIVEKFKKKHSNIIYLKHEKPKGAPAARNYGIKFAKGEFIQFLDSDDSIAKEKIEQQLNSLNKTNADMSICDYSNFRSDDEISILVNEVKNDSNLMMKVATGGSVCILTPLIKKTLVDKAPLWNEKLLKNQDVDYMLKLFILCKSYVYTTGYYGNYCHYSINRISDLYRMSPPEYRKRISSLFIFGLSKWKIIPLRNWLYFFIALSKMIFWLWPISIFKILYQKFTING